jgi:hypothetical protein
LFLDDLQQALRLAWLLCQYWLCHHAL